MKGHIKKRSKQSWSIWIDLGRDGNGRRRQKCITVRGRRKDAERELARIVNEIETGAFVEPSHMTVATYLKRWLDHARNRVSPKTHERYAELSRTHITPSIGSYKLSQLKPLHIQEFYSNALKKRPEGRSRRALAANGRAHPSASQGRSPAGNPLATPGAKSGGRR